MVYKKNHQPKLVPLKLPNPQNDVVKDKGEISQSQVNVYKIETVIENILKAKAEGLKVGLFLGRCQYQSVPQEKG